MNAGRTGSSETVYFELADLRLHKRNGLRKAKVAQQGSAAMKISLRSSTDAFKSSRQNKEGRARVGTAMGAIGAVFQPELIELMKAVLDDAAAMLPEAKRTSTMKAEIASNILACAAKGERNPTTLKIAALSAVVECTHYSHYISPERRAV